MSSKMTGFYLSEKLPKSLKRDQGRCVGRQYGLWSLYARKLNAEYYRKYILKAVIKPWPYKHCNVYN